MGRTLRIVFAVVIIVAASTWSPSLAGSSPSPGHAVVTAPAAADLIGLADSSRPDSSLRWRFDRHPAFRLVAFAPLPPSASVHANCPGARRPPPYRRRCPQRRARPAESDVPS